MKKILPILFCLTFFGGCFTNITGWDFSACDGNLSVCGELLLDNATQIFGGKDVVTVVLDNLK